MGTTRTFDAPQPLRRWTAAAVASGLLFVGAAAQAVADDVPVHVEGLSKAEVEDRIKIRTREPSEITTYRITLQPGAATPWHYHPGPHLVSIARGAVTVYEADCAKTTYDAGHGFFDPGDKRPHIHVARNDGNLPAVLVVTDVRPGGGPVRVDVPAPAACF